MRGQGADGLTPLSVTQSRLRSTSVTSNFIFSGQLTVLVQRPSVWYSFPFLLQMLNHRGSSVPGTSLQRPMSAAALLVSAGPSQMPQTTLKTRLIVAFLLISYCHTLVINWNWFNVFIFCWLICSSYIFSNTVSCFLFLQIVVQVKPVYNPPQLFPIGKETITYIATDRTGNQANCSFTVTVIGELIHLGTSSEQTMNSAHGLSGTFQREGGKGSGHTALHSCTAPPGFSNLFGCAVWWECEWNYVALCV